MEVYKIPTFKTIRQVAKMGILPEYTLRKMEKAKQLPCIYSGKRCLINVDALIQQIGEKGANEKGE